MRVYRSNHSRLFIWQCYLLKTGLHSMIGPNVHLSVNLMYQAFCIRGYKYSRAKCHIGKVIFKIRQENGTAKAP
jgi:hypothetical protein